MSGSGTSGKRTMSGSGKRGITDGRASGLVDWAPAVPGNHSKPTSQIAHANLPGFIEAPVACRAEARRQRAKAGAGGGNRTPMTLRSPDFESGASASFTTPASGVVFSITPLPLPFPPWHHRCNSPPEVDVNYVERGLLTDLRHALLHLHKTLLDWERAAYERIHGRVTGNALLQAIMNDPQFAWLHPMSQLIVTIDETLENEAPDRPADVSGILAQTRQLVSPDETGTGYAQ